MKQTACHFLRQWSCQTAHKSERWQVIMTENLKYRINNRPFNITANMILYIHICASFIGVLRQRSYTVSGHVTYSNLFHFFFFFLHAVKTMHFLQTLQTEKQFESQMWNAGLIRLNSFNPLCGKLIESDTWMKCFILNIINEQCNSVISKNIAQS